MLAASGRVMSGYERAAGAHPGGRNSMSEMMPLFPLGAVLYPGMLLPLHIFEERYRQLVRDLLDGPDPRRFGVIAIRKGRETGIDGVHSLYEVGCPRSEEHTSELQSLR